MLFPGVPSLIIDTMQFPLTFGEGDVDDFNQQFMQILEDLRRDVQKKGVNLSAYDHDYLERLRDVGKAAYNKVLPPTARNRIAELETQEQKRGLSLTFKTPPASHLFWEMLYAGKPFDVESDQFWGFRYPLGRTFWEIKAPDRVWLQAGVFSAIHDGLQFSRQEVEQLAQHLTATGQRLGLKLTLHLLEQIIPANILSVERLLELFHSSEFCYGIVHFACHTENPKRAGATQAYLSFTAHKNRLEMCLGKLVAWEEYGFVHRPFVFLNACGSATPGHLLQTLNFPTGVLNFGAGGVIATACTIPDNFASAFASELYKRLLKHDEKGKEGQHLVWSDIGEALLETRLYFLNEYNNPLGLAYGLYAVSNQQLRLID
jgi:hypothetical protein